MSASSDESAQRSRRRLSLNFWTYMKAKLEEGRRKEDSLRLRPCRLTVFYRPFTPHLRKGASRE